MILATGLAMAMLAAAPAQVPAQAPVQDDVAYEKLVAGEDEAAIRTINDNDALEGDDPARLLNLGVAYARQGNIAEARAMFSAAILSNDRQMLETGHGEWVDSRTLARQALVSLERGEFGDDTRVASR